MKLVRAAIFVVAAASALSAGILCLALAAYSLAGERNPRIDVFTHFAPIYFAGGVFAALIALCVPSRRGKLICALPGIAAALVAASFIAPELARPASPPASAEAPGQLKVIQFNAWGSNADPVRISRWLLAQKADVMVIEEPAPELVGRILRQSSYHATAPDRAVVIFSRARPVDVALPRPRPQETAALTRVRFSPEDGGFSVIGVHYTWPTQWEMHQRQAEDTYYVLKRSGFERTILCGDFNSTPWSFSRRREDRRIRLERRTRALPTWPARNFMRSRAAFPFPFLPIDHVYAGPAWRTVSVRRGPRLGSDHYPVVVTLALTQSRGLGFSGLRSTSDPDFTAHDP
jgi:endonuclease/exonuclease/phosphatase (EEP) superfamily protein YafD